MKKICYFLVLYLLIYPLNIFATNEKSDVWSGTNKYTCTSQYQDSSISTSDIAYFSYCMKATCNNNDNYEIEYFYNSNELKNNKMIVTCTNGNKVPYVELYKNGCSKLGSCSKNDNGTMKYCSVIFKYDCNKKSDGSSFTTEKHIVTIEPTTKTKKITSKTTTTTTTSAIVPVSTKLKSLELSKGSIIFNKDNYEYNINLNEEDTSVSVSAIPEDDKCEIIITDNNDIKDGSVIKVEVKAPTGESSIYKINVIKERILSNNATLKNLIIKNHTIDFNNKINTYTIIIDENESELDIEYETEDINAKVNIENNNNLQNGSKISIIVTAEDGSSKSYYIDIIKEENSNILGVVFIIILVLAIIAGAYYLYIKFISNKRGDKYEYE